MSVWVLNVLVVLIFTEQLDSTLCPQHRPRLKFTKREWEGKSDRGRKEEMKEKQIAKKNHISKQKDNRYLDLVQEQNNTGKQREEKDKEN